MRLRLKKELIQKLGHTLFSFFHNQRIPKDVPEYNEKVCRTGIDGTM